ncbi:hypothetical protein POTOM_002951 [Populus tomentosa]|uniref:DUF7705 domain-containing protein n=1 Tax=Populus tomentosa TaxID=118781 RepID=A0A8X8IZP3_POPTO|nr:hypothetical protein POTOM_002951 [Populus tomentosa]
MTMDTWRFFRLLFLACFTSVVMACNDDFISAVGDPGMRRDGLRVAIEAWNQCNEVGEEAVDMGSPRMADCFDVDHSTSSGEKCLVPLHLCAVTYYEYNFLYMVAKLFSFLLSMILDEVNLIHKVSEDENRLGLLNGTYGRIKTRSYDRYAPKKQLYLGNKCQVKDYPKPWQFWMIMLKSGNMDTLAARCPENGKKSEPFAPESRFPCFGEGCMNMPKMYHNYTGVHGNNTLRGSFYGSWDLDANVKSGVVVNSTSYFNVTWQKELGKGSWVFHFYLKTSSKYPWLMLYLRSDATKGFSGGYHYQTRGMSKIVPKSPNFKVKFKLNITQGGGPGSQFYLMDIGSCWKNDGSPCNGDVRSDVTRYSEMIINPGTESWCSPEKVAGCPPYHTFPNGTRVQRTNNASFPFDAYHMYCAPGNALHLEEPYNLCDAYSNPQPQEILQIIPHPVWGDYGYPAKKGEGWIGDPRSWELDVGRLSQSLYFYQDPGTKPVERHWPSIDLGTEIYISNDQVAEWTVSDFDILVPKDQIH